MFEADLLTVTSDVYTPWMSRGGDNAIFTVDVVKIPEDDETTVNVSVKIYHKAEDDAGDGTLVSGGVLLSSVIGRASKEYSGLLPQVRYRISIDAIGGEVELGPAYLRMLSPVWFDAVTPS